MASTIKRAYQSDELTEREIKDINNARAKAVRQAWKQEQGYVKNGQGTRDWSPEQQEDLLKNGSVHGFEGHHMRSVSNGKTYDEKMAIAEDKNNIQFLEKTKENNEHLEAHNGSTQNRTNGYYDVETGEMHDFGDNAPQPPQPEKLSNPIVQEEKTEQAAQDKQAPSHEESASSKQPTETKQTSHTDAYGVDLSKADHSETESKGAQINRGG